VPLLIVKAPVDVKLESEEAVNPVVPKTVPLQVKLAESDNRPDAPAKVILVLVSPLFVTDVAVTEVNAPVFAVVAPTVPLMLIEAVPVKLVTVPLEGVPSAPLNRTGAPVDPVLTAKAVAIPVPKPETPVEIGRPVAFVKVALEGVPRIGVIKVGEVARTLLPVPVLVTLTICLLASSAKAVDAVRPEIVIPGTVVFVVVSKYTARCDG
jgi:hypothetical protein